MHSPLKSKRALTALALAAGLAGCSQVPLYQRPAAPVAERFPGTRESTAGIPAQPAAELAWRTYFADERLVSLIDLGLANNRDLRVAVLAIERARAAYQIQRADQLPTLTGSAQHTRQQISGATTPARVNFLADYYQVGLASTAYELDFFGRVRALSEAALASYFATEEARRTTHIGLVASIANAWLSLLADEDLLRLARETVASREASVKLARLRFEGGVAPETDLQQALTLLEGARASLAQITRSRALDENALVLLVGSPVPAGMLQDLSLARRTALADLPPGLPSDLLIQRPDIRGAEQTLLSANASIGAARAAFFPRIALTGTFGLASGELSGLFSSGSQAWSFIPSVSLPIFDGGRNKANLEGSQAGRDIAVAQYEKAIQVAFREVADALAGREALRDQLNALQAQVRAEEARVRLAEIRYRGGVTTFAEVLDAQRSLFAVQQAVIQVQLAQLQNQVGLYRALGGGWKDDPNGRPAASAQTAPAPLSAAPLSAAPSAAVTSASAPTR
ncbi:MAG TPA: efflux transporter outer membrane subunit [Burkholderiaceae bacterium]|nr:efflux transporter outer membrane subunit [Burkholderiaceae bacterium]